jgi:hypothetical protein
MGVLTHTLTHIRFRSTTPLSLIESTCRTPRRDFCPYNTSDSQENVRGQHQSTETIRNLLFGRSEATPGETRHANAKSRRGLAQKDRIGDSS